MVSFHSFIQWILIDSFSLEVDAGRSSTPAFFVSYIANVERRLWISWATEVCSLGKHKALSLIPSIPGTEHDGASL